jgi:hypothetical protein
MTPAQLTAMTPGQLKQLSDYITMLRAVSAHFMKSMNQMNALNNSWNGGVSALVGSSNGTVIPDASGLAGTTSLTDTDVTNITSYFQGAMTSYYDAPHQQVMTRACGPGNTL